MSYVWACEALLLKCSTQIQSWRKYHRGPWAVWVYLDLFVLDRRRSNHRVAVLFQWWCNTVRMWRDQREQFMSYMCDYNIINMYKLTSQPLLMSRESNLINIDPITAGNMPLLSFFPLLPHTWSVSSFSHHLWLLSRQGPGQMSLPIRTASWRHTVSPRTRWLHPLGPSTQQEAPIRYHVIPDKLWCFWLIGDVLQPWAQVAVRSSQKNDGFDMWHWQEEDESEIRADEFRAPRNMLAFRLYQFPVMFMWYCTASINWVWNLDSDFIQNKHQHFFISQEKLTPAHRLWGLLDVTSQEFHSRWVMLAGFPGNKWLLSLWLEGWRCETDGGLLMNPLLLQKHRFPFH